jgi:IS605 OrfB family transposase
MVLVYKASMKLIARIQLRPAPEDAAKLRVTMERFNHAADFVADVAFGHRTANVYDLRRLCYREVRERFGLSSQMAQLAIKAASDAFKRDKSKRVHFKTHAAIPYDQRIMSFRGIDRVSLLTLEGRVKIPFVVGAHDAQRLEWPKGQADLVYRDGKWFLYVTVDVRDASPIDPTDFVGVDLGIANIATDSDGTARAGIDVEEIRKKHNLQRKRLGRRNTKGAKKKIRRMRDKEARFRRHQNHVISKAIVQDAKRTDRGIALEDLQGIRERVTARGGDARNRLGNWGFAQLGDFIVYKARLAGVSVEFVDPAYTSQTCHACGHCERSNRKSRDRFHCQACGHQAHADVNAARNIRARALAKRALGLGNQPGNRVA